MSPSHASRGVLPESPIQHEVRVSSVVMTHPRRQGQATRLAAHLGADRLVLDPEPYGPPTALRTARRAWADASPDVTHHMVLQDDVWGDPTLLLTVAASVAQHRDDALAFYANSGSRNGALVVLAALRGYSWVRAAQHEYTPTPALCLPVDLAHAFSKVNSDGTEPDDELMAVHLRHSRARLLISVPNLVEHVGTYNSLIQDDNGDPSRVSACLPSRAGSSLDVAGQVLSIDDWVPTLYEGRCWIVTADAAHREFERSFPPQQGLQFTGQDVGSFRDLTETGRSTCSYVRLVEAYGARKMDEYLHYCALLAIRVSTIPAANLDQDNWDAAMGTVGRAGSRGDVSDPHANRDAAEELATVVLAAAGITRPTNH